MDEQPKREKLDETQTSLKDKNYKSRQTLLNSLQNIQHLFSTGRRTDDGVYFYVRKAIDDIFYFGDTDCTILDEDKIVLRDLVNTATIALCIEISRPDGPLQYYYYKKTSAERLIRIVNCLNFKKSKRDSIVSSIENAIKSLDEEISFEKIANKYSDSDDSE